MRASEMTDDQLNAAEASLEAVAEQTKESQ